MTDFEKAARAEAERRWPLEHEDPTVRSIRAIKREAAGEAAGEIASWLAECLLSDESVEMLEEEIRFHRYSLVPNSNPPEAVCVCGWVGPYAGEWRRHRHRAALSAVLGTTHTEGRE